jgi:hypothetical protein
VRNISCYPEIMSSAKQLDCPGIDPTADLYVRTLHRACEKLGGVKAVAARLKVPPMAVIRWLDGASPVPQSAFLTAVDTILSGVPDRRRSPRSGDLRHR